MKKTPAFVSVIGLCACGKSSGTTAESTTAPKSIDAQKANEVILTISDVEVIYG